MKRNTEEIQATWREVAHLLCKQFVSVYFYFYFSHASVCRASHHENKEAIKGHSQGTSPRLQQPCRSVREVASRRVWRAQFSLGHKQLTALHFQQGPWWKLPLHINMQLVKLRCHPPSTPTSWHGLSARLLNTLSIKVLIAQCCWVLKSDCSEWWTKTKGVF